MSSFLPQHRVILVEPSLPENVGAVARAMNNMGVRELRLVNPCDFLGEAGLSVAANSREILQGARCFDSLEAAVADTAIVIGTTARRRDRFSEPELLPDLFERQDWGRESCAFVFGRESSGLTNQELSCCHQLVQIPTYGDSHSLNLAQAVMVVLYERSRRRVSESVERRPALAPAAEVEGLKQHLFAVLKTIGFLREHQRETLWQSFSDLIARARMASTDIRLLRGFLRRTEISIRRAGRRRPEEQEANPE